MKQRLILGYEGVGYDDRGYHLVSIVDRGAFGIVAKVYHEDATWITYARKQLPLAKIQLEKIQKEIHLIRQSSHKHVVEVIDEYQDSEWYYIVMKPLADCNLENYLNKCIEIQPDDANTWEQFGKARRNLFQWMGCLAATVKFLHDNNVRHRDIKPQNILIDGSNILLTDFGISFEFEGSTILTYTSTKGTEKYRPPEANAPLRYGRRGDVFSLGCVFFEMAETASRPVLKAPFPQITSTYGSHASDVGFRDQLSGKIEEHQVRLKQLPENYRFSNLLPAYIYCGRDARN